MKVLTSASGCVPSMTGPYNDPKAKWRVIKHNKMTANIHPGARRAASQFFRNGDVISSGRPVDVLHVVNEMILVHIGIGVFRLGSVIRDDFFGRVQLDQSLAAVQLQNA